MTKDEALDLALEALEELQPDDAYPYSLQSKAITAVKQARALDKKAENARELGLDYEPLHEKSETQRQHVTDGSPCWCEPEISYTDPKTGASVIVHKEPQ
jgi:hypothetical protein